MQIDSRAIQEMAPFKTERLGVRLTPAQRQKLEQMTKALGAADYSITLRKLIDDTPIEALQHGP